MRMKAKAERRQRNEVEKDMLDEAECTTTGLGIFKLLTAYDQCDG